VPAGQYVQYAEPVGEYVPVGHDKQVDGDVAPFVVLYVFCGQSIFVLISGQYEPGGHTEQMEAPGLENVLGLHVRHVEELVAAVELLYVPEGHGILVF